MFILQTDTILSAPAEFTVMAHIILRLYGQDHTTCSNIVMKGNACPVFPGQV